MPVRNVFVPALLTSVTVMSSSALHAQRSTKVDLDVRVSSYSVTGDTVRLTYDVENRAVSGTELWTFALATHVPSPHLTAPRDGHRWATSISHGEERMPMWTAKGDNVEPAQTVGALTITAVGITDIVEFLAVPEAPAATTSHDTTADVADEPLDQLRDRATRGKAVSIVPLPRGLTSKARLSRLSGLFEQACTTKWIASPTVCRELRLRLTQATTALSANDVGTASVEVKAFKTEMQAQSGSGKPVSMTALALLQPNADFFLRPVGR